MYQNWTMEVISTPNLCHRYILSLLIRTLRNLLQDSFMADYYYIPNTLSDFNLKWKKNASSSFCLSNHNVLLKKPKIYFKNQFPRWPFEFQANQCRPISPIMAGWPALCSRYLKRPSWEFKNFSSPGFIHLPKTTSYWK